MAGAGIGSLSDALSWCFGGMPGSGCRQPSDAISQTHSQAFLYLIFPTVCPYFSCGVWLTELPSQAAHQPLTFLPLFFRFGHCSWLSLGLLLYFIVSLDTDNIDIVKLSGLETSEDSKALQEGNRGLP